MGAVAIKKSSREKTAGFREMGTLRCDSCGEEFFIGHSPASVDKSVAEKQAKWLEKVLAEEHDRDKKHPDPLRRCHWKYSIWQIIMPPLPIAPTLRTIP